MILVMFRLALESGGSADLPAVTRSARSGH
jgi:hypothetical protein